MCWNAGLAFDPNGSSMNPWASSSAVSGGTCSAAATAPACIAAITAAWEPSGANFTCSNGTPIDASCSRSPSS